MNILLYQDGSLNLNLEAVSRGLSAAGSPNLLARKGDASFRINTLPIVHPTSYDQLPSTFLAEAKSVDFSLGFTAIPYENNYFYEARDNLAIVSLYRWELLTDLPAENGVVYLVAAVLLRSRLSMPPAHDETMGCVNDYLWDKSAVDLGMRSGLICTACKEYLNKQSLRPGHIKLLKAVEKILHDLGAASRNDVSVVDYWGQVKAPRASSAASRRSTLSPDKFDVFLCHNVNDKVEVRRLARALEARGVRTWLDEEQLRPGVAWQVVLEEQIGAIETAAIFVGDSGLGPWQDMEVRAFITEFVRRRCPVIPVILPNAKTVPELPIFLRHITWVDFRENPSEAMERLIWGITGRKPKRPAVT